MDYTRNSKMKFARIVALTLLILLSISLPASAAVYTYDSLNRLTSVTYENGHKLTYTYDAGGNILSVTVTGFDVTPPVTSITLDGQSGTDGWYRSDVQVTLTAVDNPGGSGVNKTEYSFDGTNWLTYNAPFTVNAEGTTSVYYRSTDNQGNVEDKKEQEVKIDKTPPVITGAATSQPNAAGWYNHDVTVHFTASDALSGINTVTPDIVISTEGADQSVTGTAVDKAGNSASFTVTKINIDKTKPVITVNVPADGNEYLLNANVPADWSATDALSGIASATGNVPSGIAIDTASVGTKTFTVEAVDKAGNRETKTVTYYVRYSFSGMLEPIGQTGGKEFKGNTVPVKFRLTDANGSPVTNATARLYLTNSGGGSEMDAVSTSNATTGNLFRYDNGEGQYIFNLNTRDLQSGTWKLRISLDDGTSKYGTIELARK